MKGNLVIISSNYPSPMNFYGDGFVHSRARHYLRYFNVQVLGCKPTLIDSEQYVYEGINVLNVNSKDKFIRHLQSKKYDAICIHFIAGWMVDAIVKNNTIPIFIWIHGHEALGWYRRLFNFKLRRPLAFVKYALANIRQMYRMHKLVNLANKQGNIHFIFVSKWMKRIMETDTFSTIRNFSIIPNPIDSEQFRYVEKNPTYRKKILLIRSFDSKKYANDIAVAAILNLSRESFFSELEFTIYGKGKYFDSLTKSLRRFTNVTLVNEFVENKEIPEIHRNYGVFLCPTRQDAQGVSMCEAMASGLVPITSNNTAIPEFVTDKENGLSTDAPQEMASFIKYLYEDSKLFSRLSYQAAKSIRDIAGHETVLQNELSLLHNTVNTANDF